VVIGNVQREVKAHINWATMICIHGLNRGGPGVFSLRIACDSDLLV
jgi:hypothetical protein